MNGTGWAPWVDVVVALVALGAAGQGAARGGLRTIGGLLGFLGGAWAGFVWVPGLVRGLGVPMSPVAMAAAILVGVLACASLGEAILGRLVRLLLPVPGSPLGRLDRAVGAVVTGGLTLLVLWIGAGLLAMVLPPGPARDLEHSRILRGVSAVAPFAQSDVVRAASGLAGHADLPALLHPPTLADAPVESVDPAVAGNRAVAAAAPSVLRVEAGALACGRVQEGTGFVVAPGMVVTNAHVVAGSSGVTVRKGRVSSRAEVVAFDPRRDVAVLAADTGSARPLPFVRSDLRRGQDAVVAGYPFGGPYTVKAARIRVRMHAVGPDITEHGEVTRDIYSVRAEVEPGNSGGPLLTPNGEVAGVVFARATDSDNTAFALTPQEVRPALAQARAGRARDVGACEVR